MCPSGGFWKDDLVLKNKANSTEDSPLGMLLIICPFPLWQRGA